VLVHRQELHRKPVLVHRQELHRKPELVLVHSKQRQHRCNPSCGRKYQPKHSTRSRSHIQQSPKQ
jgi:hypothetical protein